MCGSVADIQSAAAEIRRGKKERRKKERTNHRMKMYMVSLFHRATIKTVHIMLTPVQLPQMLEKIMELKYHRV